MPNDDAVPVTPLKLVRTTALLLTGYAATGTVMVVASRLRPARRPMPPTLPPYPPSVPRQRQTTTRRVAA
jgi:hypothetical protein